MKKAFLVMAFVLLFVSSVSALTYRYDGNKTFIISNDAGTIDFGEVQVLNDIRNKTILDATPFQLDLKFRLMPYRNFSKPNGQALDFFLDKISNRTSATLNGISAYVPYTETVRTYFTDNRLVWNAANGTWVMEFFLNYTEQNISGYRWQPIGDLGNLTTGGNFVANRSYFFTMSFKRNATEIGNMDVQPIFYGLRFRELAWWNSTYTYCRDLLNINETNGFEIVNEPINHGRGVFIDMSGWAHQPHNNSWAIVNAACGQGGNPVPAELLQRGLSGSTLVNGTVLFFYNATSYSNNTYSIYYDTNNVGTPTFSGDVMTISTAGQWQTTSAGGTFSTQVDQNEGGSQNFVYLGFQYDFSGGVYGFPTYGIAIGTTRFAASGLGVTGTTTCSLVYNSSLVSVVNCTNDGTTMAIQYRRYATFGTSNYVMDYTYYCAAATPCGTRQDYNNNKLTMRGQNPTAYATFTGGDTARTPANGGIGINFTGQPGQKSMLVTIQNTSYGANVYLTNNNGGGNDQVNFWQNATARRLNFTADARIGIYNQSNTSIAAIDVAITNATGVFNQGIGANIVVGAEQQNSGVTVGAPKKNSTVAGLATVFNSSITSINSLVNFTAVFDNGSGTFVNYSFSITGTSNVSNFTATLNSTPNSTIRIYFRACDNIGICSTSANLTFISNEVTPPQFSNPQTNNTFAGGFTLFQTTITDNFGLANFTFELDNGTGTAYNYTIATITGTTNVSNATALLNVTGSSTIKWRVYACDYFGNCNNSGLQTFVTGGLGSISVNKQNYTEYELANASISYTNLSAGSWLSINFSMLLQNGTTIVRRFADLVSGSGTIRTNFSVFDANTSVVEWRNFSVVYAVNGSSFAGSNTTAYVYRILLTNCTEVPSYTNTTTLTMVLRDEGNDALIVNGSIEFAGEASSANSNGFSRTYSQLFNLTNKSNQTVCIFPQWATYHIHVALVYTAPSYSVRSYFASGNFSNLSAVIDLYLLASTSSSQVVEYVVDENNLPVTGVIVQTQRFFTSTNSYKTVAQIQTDYEGKGVVNLQVEDVYYRFVLVQNDTIVAEIAPFVIICAEGNTCPPYYITLPLSSLETPAYYQWLGALQYGCSFNNVSTVLSCTVNDPTGLSVGAQLVVQEKLSVSFNQTCLSSCATAACTLTCTLGNVTGRYFRWSLYLNLTNGNQSLIDTGTLDDLRGPFYAFGDMGLILGLLIFLVLVFVGLPNPEISIVLGLFAVVISWLLGLWPITMGAVVGLVAVGVIMILIRR